MFVVEAADMSIDKVLTISGFQITMALGTA
jgi:hypothetical protein